MTQHKVELVRPEWNGFGATGGRAGDYTQRVGQIAFARGVPSPDLLPVEELSECLRESLAREGRTTLNYGPAAGYGPLREWIGERHGVEPTRVVVTTGSLHGLTLVLRLVLGGGPGPVVVEAPTYDRTLHALRSLDAEPVPVQLCDDGLDVDALAEALDGGLAPALVYTIPTFQNPSGRTLSLESRRRLVALAADRGLLLYEDDPYGLVRFAGEPLPSLHELAGGEGAIFSSSFSKTVAPGIRTGYLLLSEELVAPLEHLILSSYISPPTFVQAALFELIRRGTFERNLERVRAGLGERRDAMLAGLARELPDGARWNEPEGGYFLWLDLPAGVRADALLERATAEGVTFVRGSDFYVAEGGEEALRLAYSFASVAEIEEGVRRLGALVREAAAVAA